MVVGRKELSMGAAHSWLNPTFVSSGHLQMYIALLAMVVLTVPAQARVWWHLLCR
jgi:hypothetical protein